MKWMSINRRLIGTLFLIVSLSIPVAVQEQVTKPRNAGAVRASQPIQCPKPKSEDQKQSPDLSEALWLVDHSSDLTADIKDDQTRVQIQARVADALLFFY